MMVRETESREKNQETVAIAQARHSEGLNSGQRGQSDDGRMKSRGVAKFANLVTDQTRIGILIFKTQVQYILLLFGLKVLVAWSQKAIV